jgi:small subunit ribosomal protein S3
MGAGAQGVEVTISGKIRGSRSACAKFSDGYIKKCGEPSIRFVRHGFATVQLKPGVLGINVRIMPPDVVLPDKVDILQIEVEKPETENVEVEAAPEKPETVESVVEEIVEEAAEEAEDIIEEIVEDVEEAVEEIAEAIEEATEEEETPAKEAPKDEEAADESATEEVQETEENADKADKSE